MRKSRLSSPQNRRHLCYDRNRDFSGAGGTDVQTDWAVDPCQRGRVKACVLHPGDPFGMGPAGSKGTDIETLRAQGRL